MGLERLFGVRLGGARERRGWKQVDLANAVNELWGTDSPKPVSRSAISKIEAGSRGASIEDLFVLSAALGVSPINLVTPSNPDEPVEITPTVMLPAGRVRRWLRGHSPLRAEDDLTAFFGAKPAEEWKLHLAGLSYFVDLVDDVYEAATDYDPYSQESRSQLAAVLRDVKDELDFQIRHLENPPRFRRAGVTKDGEFVYVPKEESP